MSDFKEDKSFNERDLIKELTDMLKGGGDQFEDGEDLQILKDNYKRYSESKEKPKVVMVVGKTGCGKSTLCNALVGQEWTPTSPGIGSATTLPRARYLSENILLVDTMGLADTRDPEMSKKICRHVFLMFPTTNVITLVLAERATGEVKKEINHLFSRIWDVDRTSDDVKVKNIIVVRSKWDSEDQTQLQADRENTRAILKEWNLAKSPLIYIDIDKHSRKIDYGHKLAQPIIDVIGKTVAGEWTVQKSLEDLVRIAKIHGKEIAKVMVDGLTSLIDITIKAIKNTKEFFTKSWGSLVNFITDDWGPKIIITIIGKHFKV